MANVDRNMSPVVSAEGIVFRNRTLRHGVWKKQQPYDAMCLCIITAVTTVGGSGHKTGGSGFDSRSAPWKFPSDIFLLSSYSSPETNSVSSRNECKEISLGVKCRRR
jgi:hypothetical protein